MCKYAWVINCSFLLPNNNYNCQKDESVNEPVYEPVYEPVNEPVNDNVINSENDSVKLTLVQKDL